MKTSYMRKASARQLKQLRRQVRGAGERIGDFVSDATENTRERLSDAYTSARKGIATGARSADVAIRDHPYESLVVTLSLGVLVGGMLALLFSRRD